MRRMMKVQLGAVKSEFSYISAEVKEKKLRAFQDINSSC